MVDVKYNDKLVIRGSLNLIIYSRGLITNDYILGPSLGSGSVQSVREAIHIKSQIKRAVKCVKKIDNDENKFLNEIEVMSKLSHPNLMQIIEIYDDSKNFYIVSELCSGGELFDKIIERGIFTEKEAADIIRQILSVLIYTHQNNIQHLEINPENILLDDNVDQCIIKILDFGGARYMLKQKKLADISAPYYIAPEVIKDHVSEVSDIWSCGVILYILLCGYPPFNGVNQIEIKNAIVSGKYYFPDEEWSNVSEDAKDLIRHMLVSNPKTRFTAKDCINHPWIKNFEKSDFKPEAMKKSLLNIEKFHAENKLQRATLSFIASQTISSVEKRQLYKQFEFWDQNKDGVLSRDEIYNGYKQLFGESMANENIEKIMSELDLDNNGVIDYNEFITACYSKMDILSKKNLETIFKSIDKENSGKIKSAEILTIFNQDNLQAERMKVQNVLQEFTGEVNLEEFIELMTKLAK